MGTADLVTAGRDGVVRGWDSRSPVGREVVWEVGEQGGRGVLSLAMGEKGWGWLVAGGVEWRDGEGGVVVW